MIANGKRALKPGHEYSALIPVGKLQKTDPILMETGDVFDTLVFIEKIVRNTLADTQALSKKLKRASLEATCRAVFNFLYQHIQYTPDRLGVEELRRPARAWHDRVKGVDCDCYTIFISSILWNLGIKHYLRMTKYRGRSEYQHIYVVVPKKAGHSASARTNYFVIDPVLDAFDQEEPYSDKHDKLMMPIQYLNGIQGTVLVPGFGAEFSGIGALDEENPYLIEQDFLARMKLHLENTRKMAELNPATVAAVYEPVSFIQAIDQVLSVWDNPTLRTKYLDELAAKESQMSGYAGLNGFFKSIGNGLKKVASAVKTTAQKAGSAVRITAKKVGTAVTTTAKKVGTAVVTAAKEVGKVVMKYNPLSLAIRNGFLLAMKINLFRMAERFGYGYWTEEQARAKGMDLNEWRKLKAKVDKLKNLWNTMQGSQASLEKNIKQGWEHGTKKHGSLRGMGLGEPATAAGTAAASGVIATVAAWLKDVDWKKLFGKVKNTLEDVNTVTDTISKQKEGQDFTVDSRDYPGGIPQLTAEEMAGSSVPATTPISPNQSGTNPIPYHTPANSNNTMLLVGGGLAAAGIIAWAVTKK